MYNIIYLNNLQLATQVSFLGNFADATCLPDASEMFQKHFRLGSNERLSPQHFYNIEYFYAVDIINILSRGLTSILKIIFTNVFVI
jgi:hypothetical protein